MARITLSTHWKFLRFARVIGSKPLARGILETLWEPCWAVGDGYCGSSEDIEMLCEWKGERGGLTKALLTAGGAKGAGFIEPYQGRQQNLNEPLYQIHDFLVHCPEYVRTRRAREQENTTAKVCTICGDEYFTRTSKSRFCSDKCRQAGYRETHANFENPPNETDGLSRLNRDQTRNMANAIQEDSGQNFHISENPVTIVTVRHDLSRHSLSLTHTLQEEQSPLNTTRAALNAPLVVAVDPLEGSHHDGTTGAENDESPPPTPPSAAIALRFPVAGDGPSVWLLRDDQVAEWQALYPNIDVLEVARQALAWVQADPTRRKTADWMPKFLVTWLNKVVDQSRARGSPEPEPERVDWVAYLAACPHRPACGTAWQCDQRRKLEAIKGATRGA